MDRNSAVSDLRHAGNLPVQRLFRAGAIRGKLSVSRPDDQDEREADRMAEEAVPGKAARSCAGMTCPGGGCSACHHTMAVQRKAAPGLTAAGAPASIGGALHSGGRPLDAPVRASMEESLGADFSSVRVHTGSAAAASAQSIQALAYTVGSDVVFNAGQYAPETGEGRKLLAHELAHVVQQGQHAAEDHLYRYCDPATHSCPEGTEAPWSIPPQTTLSSISAPPPVTVGTEPSVTAVVNLGEPFSAYTVLRQAISVSQWAGLNQAANNRTDRQYTRRGMPAEPAAGPAVTPLTEITVPVQTLLLPEEPAADENFSSRLFQALTTGGGDIAAAGRITRDHIVKIWYQSSPSALRANVRIALIDPQGETGLPPGLTFQIDGHPIATTDGGLYLSPVDQATSHYLPGIIEQVDNEMQRVARAADLNGRTRAVIDFGRTITGRSPTAIASEDFNQFIGF